MVVYWKVEQCANHLMSRFSNWHYLLPQNIISYDQGESSGTPFLQEILPLTREQVSKAKLLTECIFQMLI